MSASQQNIASTTPSSDLVSPAEPEKRQPAWPMQRSNTPPKITTGDNKTQDHKPMPTEAPPSPVTNETGTLVISAGISIQGTIMGAKRLVVEGIFESDRIETAELAIARTGVFRGTADVRSADIDGRFAGELIAKERLRVRSNGTVTGTAQYGKLAVEDGGEISAQLTPLKARV